MLYQGKGLKACPDTFLITKDIDQVDLAVFVLKLIDTLEDQLL